MSLTTLPDASRAPSTRSPSCGRPGCGRRSAPVRAGPGWLQVRLRLLVLLGVLAEHAEQAAHLGQPGPGGITDRGEPLRARVRQAGRGQPAGLRLHRDHRDVVRDHIVQLAGDPGPLPPGQVIGQHPLGELAGSAVGLGLLARPPHQRGHRRDRDRRRQQHRQHPGVGVPGPQDGRGPRDRHRPRAGIRTRQDQREAEERRGQRDGQDHPPTARQPVRGHQERGRSRDRHQLEQDERRQGRNVHRQRRGERPEPSGRHRGEQAERAHQQRSRQVDPGMRRRPWCQFGVHGRLGAKAYG